MSKNNDGNDKPLPTRTGMYVSSAFSDDQLADVVFYAYEASKDEWDARPLPGRPDRDEKTARAEAQRVHNKTGLARLGKIDT